MGVKSYLTLLKNEGKLSVRDMNMIIFSIAMPLVVLVVLGIIYGVKPAVPGADHTFLEQSFGAVCGISMCAGGLMGLPIVVSDYRERKILKRFQVTPMSPMLLLIVELSIYIFYCVISLLLCGVAATVFWRVQLRENGLAFFGSWLLTMLSTLSIGLLVGGAAKNSKQASVIACILYFPMLIFSGTTVPLEILPKAMQAAQKAPPPHPTPQNKPHTKNGAAQVYHPCAAPFFLLFRLCKLAHFFVF